MSAHATAESLTDGRFLCHYYMYAGVGNDPTNERYLFILPRVKPGAQMGGQFACEP
jgi:hypothetical protein